MRQTLALEVSVVLELLECKRVCDKETFQVQRHTLTAIGLYAAGPKVDHGKTFALSNSLVDMTKPAIFASSMVATRVCQQKRTCILTARTYELVLWRTEDNSICALTNMSLEHFDLQLTCQIKRLYA